MATNTSDGSQRKAAIAAGISIVIMAVVAGFSFGFVFNRLVVPGDAATTATNIVTSDTLFRAGVFGWLIILILDVVVAWGLYLILKKTNRSLSLLTAWFRLVYAAILGVGLLCFVIVLLLNSGVDYLTVFETDQLNAATLLFLNAFIGIWDIGLMIFGCHLFLLGYLVFISGTIPRILGGLLIIASFGYLIVGPANLLMPAYGNYVDMFELVLTLPMVVGELGLGLWLLFKGGRESATESPEMGA